MCLLWAWDESVPEQQHELSSSLSCTSSVSLDLLLLVVPEDAPAAPPPAAPDAPLEVRVVPEAAPAAPPPAAPDAPLEMRDVGASRLCLRLMWVMVPGSGADRSGVEVLGDPRS
jgi:hypothetical protein